MALFIHSVDDAYAAADHGRLKRLSRYADSIALTEGNFRIAVHAVASADVLLVPDDVARCSPAMERLKTIARNIPVDVLPLSVYTRKLVAALNNKPAAALAEPRTQQGAVCGFDPSFS